MRRGHHGSTKVPNVKLKPVPKSGNYSRDPGVALYDATSGTARDSLRNDARPFSGFEICGSGVKDKIVLFGKARELGATCSNDLTDLTTHLVADEPGSAKYQCAVELGIPVLTSDWILDTHTRWLAGVDIDPEECTSEHLLPPLKGVVICATRLSNTEDRQRVTKSAVRLGAKYQAHMDKAATHLLIGPDDAATVDSQKLQWVLRTNEKRLKEQSEEPRIHVVWDSWLLYCAATSSRVPEGDFAYSENGTRPDPPDDIERVLRRSLNKKPAKVYVTASNVGAGTKGKDVLEKARIKKGAPAASVWNGILSARGQGARDDDSFVPPTQMQVVPNSTSSISVLPMPVSDAPPPQIDVDDSATEDEDESTQRKYGAASSSRAEPKSVVPAERGIAQGAQIGAGKATSMVSRLNSLRGSAFQFGTGATSNQNASSSSSRPLARITSAAAPGQGMTHAVTTAKDRSLAPTSAGSCKVFAGKCIAPIGEARAPKMYSALRAHGAIVIEGLDAPLQSKGKGTAKDDETVALPQEEVDYYIVRLASESARSASKLECFHKFRTDCWVEHCIFQDRLCLVEEDVTYSPLKAQLPIPGLENVKLHWTGMNNEQETAAKRLTKALGITVTDTFNRRINTHLLCLSGSGLKYNKALQWKVPVVKMDWLYDIAKQGRIPDIPQAQSHPNDTSATGNETTAGPSMLQPTSPHTTSKNTSANISLFGTPNGLLGPSVSSPEPAALPPLHDSTTTVLAVSNQSSARDEAAPIASTSADQLETTLTSSTKDSSRPEDTSARRSQSKDLGVHLDQDGEREREAHRNQLADSLGELLKKHQLDEPAQHDQPRKRMRPPQRQKGAVGATSGTTSRSHSLSDKVSLMSLQTRASDSDYISPLEAMEPVHEETLQVHYLDPNQHAAKEGLLRLLDGSSQVVDPDIINLDTQTEPEESQARPQVLTKRKRGGAAGGGGKRKNQRKA